MDNTAIEQEEVEIDLLELLAAMRERIWIILFTVISGGIIGGLVSVFLISPVYTSTTKLLVLTKETTLASLADLQMGSQLTNDYQVLIKSRPVLEQVIDELSLAMDYQQLSKSITIENPSNTRILELKINCTDKELSAEIANCLAEVASDFIGDQMEVVPPKVVEEGIVPERRTSPSHSLNAVIGALIGLALSGGMVCLNTIMDDSIKSEEDIKKYLELPMLARIPDRKDFINLSGEEAGIKKKGLGSRLGFGKKKAETDVGKKDTDGTGAARP